MAVPIEDIPLIFEYFLPNFEALWWFLSINCKHGLSQIRVISKPPLFSIFSEIFSKHKIHQVFSPVNLQKVIQIQFVFFGANYGFVVSFIYN